ncbi:hypothetical protein EKD04_006385 [Chloroflexales bacterium ZM16-3]|nr:hypothetical protein [Chloroflexales bacterium ZM16-3]
MQQLFRRANESLYSDLDNYATALRQIVSALPEARALCEQVQRVEYGGWQYHKTRPDTLSARPVNGRSTDRQRPPSRPRPAREGGLRRP